MRLLRRLDGWHVAYAVVVLGLVLTVADVSRTRTALTLAVTGLALTFVSHDVRGRRRL